MSLRIALLLTLAVASAAEWEAHADCDPDTCDTVDTVSLLQKDAEVHSKKDVKVAPKEAAGPEILQQTAVKIDTSKPLSGVAAAAEFLAMTLFVVLGCGSAMALKDEPGWLMQVSLVFGLAITCLAYAIGHYSGGQINCAVTFGLCLTGNCTWLQGIFNFVAQMCGSVFGALILSAIFGEARDKTGGLGTNAVAPEVPKHSALIAEIFGTFLLMFVVLQTACNPATTANSMNAPIAIGLAVFLAHCFMIPLDGCSINPTRTFGPMLVRKMSYKNQQDLSDHWVFWAGPLLGAALAAGVSKAMG